MDAENFRSRDTNVVVVGCGGGGVNAINRMIYNGMSGVTFVAMNTDIQSLEASPADVLLPLGRALRGTGAGANPDIGRRAAEESEDQIVEILNDADMVFITAGMGGGTGSGAAPVVARICQDLHKLTIAVVTSPFQFEGKQRASNAETALAQLRKILDTVLVIPNQVLVTRCDPTMRMTRAFELADDTLFKGVSGVADLITTPGEVNLDFNDIRRLLSRKGLVYWGIGYGQGDGGCMAAAEAALHSPFMEDRGIQGAHSLIVNVCGGENLRFLEAEEVLSYFEREASKEAEIKLGTSFNPDYQDHVRITIIAKGVQVSKPKTESFLVENMASLLNDQKRGFGALTPEVILDPMTPAILRKYAKMLASARPVGGAPTRR